MISSSTKRAVEQFLSNGKVNGLSPAELAEACNQQVRLQTQISCDSALEMAHRFIKNAEPVGGVLYLTALRALGWTFLFVGQYGDAEKTYLKARRLYRNDAFMRARIDRILIDVYMYLGRNAEAKRRARMSLSTFARMKSETEYANTLINYGNVYHRQDRHLQARGMYEQAAEYFLKKNVKLTLGIAWFNLANTCVQLCDFDQAGRLFAQARKIYLDHDHKINAMDCLFGLAWLERLKGNFHIALRDLSECEALYAETKQMRRVLLCQLDRADAYLGLNLFADARDTSEQAGKNARRQGLIYEAAKADLIKGKALEALGHSVAAKNALRRAEIGFAKEKNSGYEAVVQLALARMIAGGKKQLENIHAARKKFTRAQMPLWEAICDLQIASDWPTETSALRRLARNRAVKTVPYLSSYHHTIIGDRHAGRHQMKSAIEHWTVAADILDALRAKLPPLEMRSSFFSSRGEPHRRLIQAEYKKKPLQAAIWSERHKTAGVWSTAEDFYMANPARARIQEKLSQLSQYFAALSRDISASRGKRGARSDTPVVLKKIQREIRHNMIELERTSDENISAEAIGKLVKDISRRQSIVQFHIGDKDILAFVHQSETTRAVCYADGTKTLRDMLSRWRFLVECAPSPLKKTPRSLIQDQNQILARISAWLLHPLELSNKVKRLLLVPEGQLWSLPWMGLPSGGDVFGEKYQLTFIPSIRHHAHAKRQRTKSRSVKVFVGNDSGLPHLRSEVRSVSSRIGAQQGDIYRPAKRTDWPEKSQARIWHYAGHAHLRGDNPFYSSLLLDDGPLFAADFRLKRNRVGLVTLAACRTGQQTSLPGEEASGLVRSLLEMGAANVVASSWAVSDRSTSLWMESFYEKYLDGSSASEAAQEASLVVRESFPLICHWGSFTVHGAG